MRAIECRCGHHLEATDDEQLFRLAREHIDRDHPEMQPTDDQIRQRVAADAYDAGPLPVVEPAPGDQLFGNVIIVNRLGPKVSVNLERYGFYPAGGGCFTATIEPRERLSATDLTERGEITRTKALSGIDAVGGL